MKRLVAFVLLVGAVFGTVANAQEVSAPQAIKVALEVQPSRRLFKAYVPAVQEDPVAKAIREARETVVAEATVQGVCVEWAGVAFDVGWPPAEIPRLLKIINRESRCRPDACSTPDRPDVRRCRDWGLTQINDHSWKRIVREQGMEMSDMWVPEKNLAFALWLFRYSEGSTGCGWTPWAGSC